MRGLRREKYIANNWRKVALQVVEIAKRYGNLTKAVVFGDVPLNSIGPYSTIDILLIFDEPCYKITLWDIKIASELGDKSDLVDIKVISKDNEENYLKLIKDYIVVYPSVLIS
ncbi:hypothetical protein HS7_13650 [Sulfolobales archaeon HS-7]|nr:hypothetical protein HS7_13650 [Sulfolobales archaeon HS-7]